MRRLFIILVFFSSHPLFALNKFHKDSTKLNAIKIDFNSLYYTIFDTRIQRRVGVEYERKIKHNICITSHLDFGLYDDYKFIKFYDFFTHPNGPVKEKTYVRTKGFHFLQGVSKIVYQNKKNRFFANIGLLMDISSMSKKERFISYDASNNYKIKNQQFRIGFGPEISLKRKLYKSLFFELRNSIVLNTFTVVTNRTFNDIKPYKSFWFNDTQRMWLVSMMNIVYEF